MLDPLGGFHNIIIIKSIRRIKKYVIIFIFFKIK